MAVQALPRLREVLGDEGVDELVHWLDGRIAEQAVPRDEYREVLSRLDILEHDVSDIKVEVRGLRREMNERFDRVNERFEQMSVRVEERFREMDEQWQKRFEQMNARFGERFDQMHARFGERFDQMHSRFGERFDQMHARSEERFDQMHARSEEHFDQMHARFDDMYERMLVQTRWLIGSLALIGTVVSVLLAIGQFVK